MQVYKGDPTELKIIACAEPILSALSVNKTLFNQGCYDAAPLADVIYQSNLAPLTNAIASEIFRDSFKELLDAFVAGGTFESYLTVFRKIFGDTVEVTFTVPAAGKLSIDIVASGSVLYDAVSRRIVSNAYVFDELITQDGADTIAFQLVKGFKTQYEVEQMLFELVPAGVFTDISLTIGD